MNTRTGLFGILAAIIVISLSLFFPGHALANTSVEDGSAGRGFLIRGRPARAPLTARQVKSLSALLSSATPIGASQGVTDTLSVSLLPRLLFSGQLPPLEFEVSGVTLAVPAGLQLTEGGAYAPTVTLRLPTEFGSGAVSVNELRIEDGVVSLGGASGLISLPDIVLGENGGIALTNNIGQLVYDNVERTYHFDINSTLTVDTPEPARIDANVTLRLENGQPQLSGEVRELNVNVGGGSLQMSNAQIDNDGLYVPNATLTLPAAAGSATIAVDGVRIGQNGIAFDQTDIQLPDIALADGAMGITGAQANAAYDGSQYVLTGRGTLTMSLPENDQTTDITFVLDSDGQLRGEVTGLALNVAGTTVALGDTLVSSEGLSSTMALLKLPDELGGATAVISDVTVTSDGLAFGSGDLSITLPSIPIGEGISLTDNVAQLSFANTPQGLGNYIFNVNSTLNMNLAGDEQQSQISFQIAPDVNGQAQISGAMSGLTIPIGSATLALSDITLNNAGLFADSATLSLPSELGGGTAEVGDVSLTANGLNVGGGSFDLPDIVLGDGSLMITDAEADVTTANGQYQLTGQGTLSIQLPDSEQTAQIVFTLGEDGLLRAATPGLALNLNGTGFELGNSVASSEGFATSKATLTLPEQLGSVSVDIADASLTSDGLTLGAAGVSGRAPDLSLGNAMLAENDIAISAVASPEGDKYVVLLDTALTFDQDGQRVQRPVRVAINTGGPLEDDAAGLSVTLGGLTFTLIEK
jgi:hypothetical protein